MYCLLEVVSVCPEKLAPRFSDRIDWIKVRTTSTCDQIKYYIISLLTSIAVFKLYP